MKAEVQTLGAWLQIYQDYSCGPRGLVRIVNGDCHNGPPIQLSKDQAFALGKQLIAMSETLVDQSKY